MSWLDKLEHIIKVDLRGLKIFSPNINIIRNPEKKEKATISEDKKIININFDSLEDSEKKELLNSIKQGFDDNEIKNLLEDNSEKLVKDIKLESGSQITKKVLDFYKDKISYKHYQALEASLYLRRVFERGEPINNLKRDIVQKFGEDGRNICNLCSAGYFEGHIKQVYSEMSFSKGFSIVKFKDHFEDIVKTSPFAIFVSKETNGDELSGEIYHKLQTYKKYGVSFLAIHGIGKNNIKKINKIIQELEEEIEIDTKIKQDGNIIIVKIFLVN